MLKKTFIKILRFPYTILAVFNQEKFPATEILFFPAVLPPRSRCRFPSANILIPFGSYARGQWVEDTYTEGHIKYEYISDFDILVLTRLKKTANDFSYFNGQS
jgi:hypothetical protein